MGQQFDLFGKVYDDWEYERCGVESNGIQVAITRHYEQEGIIPIEALHTGAKQKVDESVGLPALASQFQAGLWHIPWADAASRAAMGPLVEELKGYPVHKFSDTVMAIFFADTMWQRAPKSRGPTIDFLDY